MGRDIDRNIRDIIKNEVKRGLERDEGAVFSRTELIRKFRRRIQWKGTGDAGSLAEMYESGQISRRRFLKMLGIGVGSGIAVSSGVGYFMGMKIFDERKNPPTGYATNISDNVIRSAPGNNVATVFSLDDAAASFTDGTTVVLKSGTYDDYGEGIADELFGGSKGNCSLIGDGDVILKRDKRDHIRTKLNASGNVRIQNFTIRGKRGAAQSQNKFGSDENATIEWININMPDGTMECTDSLGIDADEDHKGVMNCINCSWQLFGNSACYVNGAGGPVNFDSCFWRNNSAPVRYFTPGSVLQKCVGVCDADSIPGFVEDNAVGSNPSCDGGWGRVIKVEKGEGTIRDSDFFLDDVGAVGPVLDIQKDSRSRGTLQNIRIRNESDEDPIHDSGGYADSWTAENICILGSGSKDVPSEFRDAVNSNCQQVKTEPPNNPDYMNTNFGASAPNTAGTEGKSKNRSC